MTALVDTNVFYARASEKDAHHDKADDLVGQISKGDVTDVRVIDPILAETTTLISSRMDRETAIDILDRIKSSVGFSIVQTSVAHRQSAEAYFRQDADLAFFDAYICGYMDQEEIGVLYSFDTDFDPHVDRRESV